MVGRSRGRRSVTSVSGLFDKKRQKSSNTWCFDAQCFYVLIFTPDDGVTEHRNMSG
jgi:hypothetical protein